MEFIDWIVLFGTLIMIVAYGTWKTRGNKDIEGYLKGDNKLKWATIGLSVMATQASAITFLSTPGQAFESGMGFVQNYFGLPLAIIIICAFFIPIYYKLKVYTAYEFLESRFDHKNRALAAFIFLVQRGLGAGITIYAPAIILSKSLSLSLDMMILVVGILVIIYTVSGGTRAVSLTQKYQMGVIFLGMFTAFFVLVSEFPDYLSFGEALNLAGSMDKLQVVDLSFDVEKRYTIWSGIAGGIFLSLSYFGTDQSQVQRYLGAESVTQSRMGLIFNAVLKIPMQFFILFVGVMVFVFYQIEKPPMFFNSEEIALIEGTEAHKNIEGYKIDFDEVHDKKRIAIEKYAAGDESQIPLIKELNNTSGEIRDKVKSELVAANPDANVKDSDYVFITFIINYLPHGIIGLLFAVILSAAMSSTSSELNALGSTTMIDFYKRSIKKKATDRHYLIMSKVITMMWGVIAIGFALSAQLVENLIEFVNIVGSLFYGTPLGIFIVAFFIKKVKGTPVFIAALVAQAIVIVTHVLTVQGYLALGYLWYNAIGCVIVIILSYILQITGLFGKR